MNPMSFIMLFCVSTQIATTYAIHLSELVHTVVLAREVIFSCHP